MDAICVLLKELSNVVDFSLEDNQNQYLLQLKKNDDLIVEITIPKEVCEWYVSIFRKEQKVFTDWLDYYGDSEENLIKDMCKDLKDFIIGISNRKIRISANKLEWENEGKWLTVW